MHFLKISVAIATLSALLSGCAAAPNATPTAPNILPAEKELAVFYSQKIEWSDCGDKLTCSKVLVPLNYQNLSDGSIEIAINQYSNTQGQAIGDLLVNPGGPGSSGIEFLSSSPETIATDQVRAKYNLVGFDPRGVQNSAPVKCLSDTELDEFLYATSGFEIGSAEDLAHSKDQAKSFADACHKVNGNLLAHVDSESAARDMDIIRAVLGREKLDYLGFSYGSYLGTLYAALFPDRVGHLILDGAVDPSESGDATSVGQLIGFDSALKAYLKNCLAQSNCPFEGSVEQAQEKIRKFLLSAETKSLKNDDDEKREVTVWAIETGMMMALYSNDYWTYLTDAFTESFDSQNGTTFQRLADYYNDRGEDGHYISNLDEANIAISCIDERNDFSDEALAKQNAKLLKASPTLGRYWQNGALLCAYWPYPVARTVKDFSAKGAAPIIVIGTSGDPATPYSQSVKLAHDVLADGFLITYTGEGHTAYGRSNSCVSNVVDDYLLNSTLPAAEPKC